MKIFGTFALLIVLGATAFAQAPHLAYVYPAGGKAGTTFQITVGGQFLLTVSNAFVTGPGITAKVLDHNRPMNQKDFNDLRDRLKTLTEKLQANRRGNPGTNGAWTSADVMELRQVREKILKNPPNRTANPAMIDTVTIKIAIAADATPGDREIRLAAPNFLSNPMKFCVGDLPEITKPAAKSANPDFGKFLERLGGPPAPTGTPRHEAQVELPVTINGQIMPGGVDRYRFFATRGQQLVIAASARSLIPYLADAVPGWFEAVLTIYDASGRELACDERFRFKPDPVMRFEVPRDGEYTVEINDSIFRGREDFVYRLTIGQLPFVTGIFPLGGRAGEKTTVALAGWNLPEQELTLDITGGRAASSREKQTTSDEASPLPSATRASQPPATGVILLGGKFFNSVPFAVDDLPEIFSRESNHTVETAQAVDLPVIINGRVARPGEQEVFKFDGHAGESVVAEVFARRLDSPLDSFLRLTDAAGKQLAFNDDFEDKGCGLETFHADSYLTATLPAAGVYFVHLTDTEGQGGPAFAYRLRISGPQPDFALRIVPSSLSLRAGMSAPLTVYALRHDGFTNAITLDLKDAPAGFSLSGARIAENQDKAQFTVKAPPRSHEEPVAIAIVGHAVIAGKTVARDAVPAEDLMQAFFYRQLVPSAELAVTVAGQPRLFLRDVFKIISAVPVKIPMGGIARVRVSAPAGNFSERFNLELDNPPDGISLTNVSAVPAGLELVFSCDAEKAKPGVAGNLICDVVPKNLGPANPQKKPGNPPRRVAVATLPAVPFTISAE